ncbi:hypothetical protein ACQPZ8_26525 [Actinomadura nitritigenes]|uniref:hypothetical protein n=1 Tax=Actinomadura nitritigenes TaxID=134602 RepID=UPI003D922491
MVSDRLREAKEAGTVRADTDPGLTAAEVIAFMHGAHTQWLFAPQDVDLRGLYNPPARGQSPGHPRPVRGRPLELRSRADAARPGLSSLGGAADGRESGLMGSRRTGAHRST